MVVRMYLITLHCVFCVVVTFALRLVVVNVILSVKPLGFDDSFLFLFSFFFFLFSFFFFLLPFPTLTLHLQHAIKCGAGSGAFICLRTSAVYLVRDGRCCLWGSPYLDAHGEEDALLERGRPLTLDPKTYFLITNALLSHTFDDLIMQNGDGVIHKKPRPSRQL
jgi:hypothetical protein